MAFKAILAAGALLLGSGNLSAYNESETLWKEAYTGHFSLVHKMTLVRPEKTLEDSIMKNFIMAYVYYRLGDEKNALKMFESIDTFLEHTLIQSEQ